ncbi:MAG: alpha-2-macroglobulin [Chloracidobacterium sp. CP2_5A]|nr:MAG: alpha-2-macroglobulin [Chloracidobacterium sp. CP2_5A]
MSCHHDLRGCLASGLLCLAAWLFFLSPPFRPASAQALSYQAVKAEAERLYAEGSYELARQRYAQLDLSRLDPADQRWVKLRLADCDWRSRAATTQSDWQALEAARVALEALVNEAPKPEDRDAAWAEAQESLGDFWQTRRDRRNWHQGWQHYAAALDWWAHSKDLAMARERYLRLLFKAAYAPDDGWGRRGERVQPIPIATLEEALTLAQSEDERAHLRYLTAMSLRRQGGDYESIARVAEEFAAAVAVERQAPWYDDALFHYGQWLELSGRPAQQPDGTFQMQPDYAGALEQYRRLVAARRAGGSRYLDEARARIASIAEPGLTLAVGNVFLPGSEIRFGLSWRNVKRIELALYPIDLTRDARPTAADSQGLKSIDLAGRQPVKTLARDGEDRGDYRPRQALVTLDGTLPAGAYLLEARAGKLTARELALVTDAALITKADRRRLVVFACSALDGAPIPNMRVMAWLNSYDAQRQTPAWRSLAATTDRDGVATFDALPEGGCAAVVLASAGARQALCVNSGGLTVTPGSSWKLYAFTDRAAYRPGDTVQWKLIARQMDGKRYQTPAGAALDYELFDPRGEKVAEGRVTLSQFGGAWGEFKLAATLPLGEYRIRFGERRQNGDLGEARGEATLFRLEEYRLPEFRVTISTPEENGRRRAFRAGDRVEATISAERYFGGAVAGGRAEVMVSEQPLYRALFRKPDDAWEAAERFAGYAQGGRVVKRETLTLDADGRARLVIPTPRFAPRDLEYRIEARVVDASRREVVEQAVLRVGRQRFAVEARPERNLLRPGERIAVTFRARDVNDQPVAAEGQVTVTREAWREIFLDARGREATAAEAGRRPESGPYRLKQRGYEREEILTRTVQADPKSGDGRLEFVAPKEGFYRVAWMTPEPDRNPIVAEATLWVSTTATTDTGYFANDLEIIADRDALAVGQSMPLMLAAATSGRTVLLSTIRDGLEETRVIRMTGTSKLVELDIAERDAPNFQLEADSLLDLRLSSVKRDFIVPLTARLLNVEVTADRAEIKPRETATLTIVTRSADGSPLPAEVALAVTDDAVGAIQTDYAPDPREFFHGERRQAVIVTASSPQCLPYARLKPKRPAPDEPSHPVAIGDLESRPEGHGQLDLAAHGESGAAPAASAVRREAKAERAKSDNAAGKAAEGGQLVVRSDFRATAFWQPDIRTGPDGRATVKVTFPDSLTTWKAIAWGVSLGSEVGQAQMQVVTNQPLIVRLQTPRFLIAGDRATLSAVVNNRADQPATVAVTLDAEGIALDADKTRQIAVPPRGEGRVDWPVSVVEAGRAAMTVTAVSDRHRDAMARTLPVYARGVEKFLAKSVQIRAAEATLRLDLPPERDGARLAVQATPSLAATMLDALPYLLDYPYGCTEQTMSRFLPAVVVAKTLREQGLKPEDVAGRMFGGIEPATADKTHAKGKRDLSELDRIVREGLDRLYDFQKPDGGWGWWKETETDRFMTAYVAWGLALAKQAGLPVKSDALGRGVAFLESQLRAEEDDPDRQAWLLHAMAEARRANKRSTMTPAERLALDNLWAKRDRLTAYGRALLALAAQAYGDAERARVLARNLENGVVRDTAGDVPSARWGAVGPWHRWADSPVETTAFVLKALVAIEPSNPLAAPAMTWLVNNRRGAQWSNTRDTAISVLALNDYLRATGEAAEPAEYEIVVNGATIARQSLAPADILAAPGRFVVPAESVRDGANDIRIIKRRGRALYVAAQATFLSRESPIPAAGHELSVKRQYWRLVPRPTLLRGVVYERAPLRDGEAIHSGDRLLCAITIEAKNDYEYLVFEDLKPAGFEPVQTRSGTGLAMQEIRTGTTERTGRALAVYQELRDRQAALFVDRLPQGVWQVEYELRAETPGRFSALPTLGHAMYVPEIRANGAETRVVIGAEGEAPPPARARSK